MSNSAPLLPVFVMVNVPPVISSAVSWLSRARAATSPMCLDSPERLSCALVIVAGWNGRRVVGPDMGVTSHGDLTLGPAPPAANAAKHQDCVDASPVC